MRASLGHRFGPLYVGTGNLLHTRRRRHSGGEILAWVILAPFLLVYFTGVALWWLAAVSWRRSVRAADRHIAAADRALAEPADDPCWTPRR